MIVESSFGTFRVPDSAAEDTVLVTNFRPKAGLIWGANTAKVGVVAPDLYYGFGAFAANSGEVSVSIFSEEGLTTDTNTKKGYANSLISVIQSASVINAASLKSISSSGISLDWTTVNDTGVLFSYALWGGDDITNTNLVEFNSATGAIEETYTGVGFLSDGGIFFSVHESAVAPIISDDLSFSVGFATSETQACSSLQSTSASVQSTTVSHQSFGNIIVKIDDIAGTGIPVKKLGQIGQLTEYNSDGFKIQWTKENTNDFKCVALLFEGGNFQVGSGVQRASAGTKGVDTNFEANNILFSSFGQIADTGMISDIVYSFGVSSGDFNNNVWLKEEGDSGFSNTGAFLSATHSIVHRNISNTLLAQSQVSDVNATGFLNNWTTADVSSRQFIFMAMGSGDAPPATFSQSLYQVGRLVMGIRLKD